MDLSRRAGELLIQAQALPAGERAAFIDEACRDNDALRNEVLSLLAAAEESEGYFDNLSEKVGLSALADDDAPQRVDKVIGRWRLRRRIGRGGMGSVYLAERADEQFEQQGAMKILPFGLDSEAARLRFLTERQILARLVHDNIARLLDGGVTDDGVPFFVMDYVDGVPIDAYCDQNRLDVDARIRLFLGVLAAVSHAHSHLVVHRDIKPSNVLVTTDGTVKLLDFGVAKMLTGDSSGGQTRELGLALTPEYAAPEQLMGEAVTTSTDVYSLGLLLYALLAGRNPRAHTDSNALKAMQALAETEPPRLSDFATDESDIDADEIAAIVAHRKTSLAALRRTMKGDLDNILQKALALQPEERYASVGDFAADLRRYLIDEPVTALPATVAYRMRKFVRRHRGGVLITALTLVALLASTAITAWQAAEARRQRDAALYHQQRVQATNEFLGLLFSYVGPDGEPLTLIELLDRGVELLDRKYGVEDEFIASTLASVSVFYVVLGAKDKRAELIDRAIGIARDHGDDELLASLLCASARDLVDSDLAGAQARYDEGESILARVRTRGHGARVDCYRAKGLLLAEHGDPENAVIAYEAALEAIAASPTNPIGARANVLNDIGEQYFNTDRPDAALAVLEEALSIKESIGLGNTMQAIIERFNVAAVMTRMGEISDASDDQREGLRRLESAGRPVLGASGHYANSLLRLARYEEALELFTNERNAAQESGNARWVTTNEMQIGRTLARMGRVDDAEVHLAQAEADYRRSPERHARMLVMIALARADILLHRGDTAAATAVVRSTLSDLGYPEQRDAPGLSAALWTGARVAVAAGDFDAAEQFADASYRIVAAMARDESRSADVGQALYLRGKARFELGDRAQARDDLQRAVEALSNGFGANHPETVEAKNLLQQT